MTSQTITALGNAIINFVDRKTPIATANTVGMVKPDGSTINIDANGVISSTGGSSSLEVCDIGIALYVDETKGLRRYLNGQIVDINTNTQAFLTRLKSIVALHPSLLDTEENWQAAKARSPFRQVGKFVFNYSGDEIVSVRLPRVVNVQGLFDLQNLGMTVGQALPSHTHTRGNMNIAGALSASNIWAGTAGASGCFSVADNGYHNSGGNGGSGCNTYTWFYNASNNWTGSTSAPNYTQTVNNGAVQQEAIQYPYFIQIATGQETENNITNEIELNTPSFFGDSKYVPTKVNNLSWLKSEGQNNPKGTYPSFYDWILENVNKGVENFKTNIGYAYSTSDKMATYWISSPIPVVGATVYGGGAPVVKCGIISSLVDNGFVFTDTKFVVGAQQTVTKNEAYNRTDFTTDYDFVINTTDETFRLPLLNGEENIISDKYDELTPEVGVKYVAPANGVYCFNGTDNAVTGKYNVVLRRIDRYYGVAGESTNHTAAWTAVKLDVRRGNAVKLYYEGASQITDFKFRFYYATGNGSLYYYVGETVQNANLIDAGRIGEILPTKTDMQQAAKASMPSRRFIDLSLGAGGTFYTAPADGWVFLQGTVANGGVHLVIASNPGIAYAPRPDNFWSGMLPIRKGEQWTVFYSSFTANLIYRFYYAEGAQ